MDSDSYDCICAEYNSMNSDRAKDMELVTEKLRRKRFEGNVREK